MIHETAGEGRDLLYSSLPLSPGRKQSDIYLQLYIWDDYWIYLIAEDVITKLLLDEIYPQSSNALRNVS